MSKLKDFVPSKLNFSENLSSLDARNEFLYKKKTNKFGKKLNKTLKPRKNPKTQGNFGIKTQQNCQNSIFRKTQPPNLPEKVRKKEPEVSIPSG